MEKRKKGSCLDDFFFKHSQFFVTSLGWQTPRISSSTFLYFFCPSFLPHIYTYLYIWWLQTQKSKKDVFLRSATSTERGGIESAQTPPNIHTYTHTDIHTQTPTQTHTQTHSLVRGILNNWVMSTLMAVVAVVLKR